MTRVGTISDAGDQVVSQRTSVSGDATSQEAGHVQGVLTAADRERPEATAAHCFLHPVRDKGEPQVHEVPAGVGESALPVHQPGVPQWQEVEGPESGPSLILEEDCVDVDLA